MRQNLGAEFKKARERNRLSLDKISQKTKINVKYLKAIENNQFDFLHGPYVFAFVKAYAQALGMDVDAIKEKLDRLIKTQLGSLSVTLESKQYIQKTPDRRYTANTFGNRSNILKIAKHRRKPIVLILLIIVFIILIVTLRNMMNTSGDEIVQMPQNEQLQAETRSSLSEPAPPQSEPEKMLQMRLDTHEDLESLWFQVIIDDDSTDESIFFPGDSRVWEAHEKFEIRAGLSTGFDLIFNGDTIQFQKSENAYIGKMILMRDSEPEITYERHPPDTSAVRIHYHDIQAPFSL